MGKVWMPRVAAVTMLVCAFTMAGCSTPSQTQGSAQQAEVLRLTLRGSLQRDEHIENITGVQRNTVQFPVVKSSVNKLYADPVVEAWVIAGLQRDPKNFMRDWGAVAARGLRSIDDATALKYIVAFSKPMGRLSASECATFEAQLKAKGKADEFARVRVMQPPEIVDFFDAMTVAMRAGINNATPRAVSSPAAVATALVSAGAAMGDNGRNDSCALQAGVASALEKASLVDRTHLINFILNAAASAMADKGSVAAR